MGDKSSKKDVERTTRLRENKRRHRARQRDYTADLEQRLTQLQKEGVQATIEVQVASRKVAEENKCLRNLLHHMGLDTQTIDAWIREATCTSNKGGCSQQSDTRRSAGKTCSQAKTNMGVKRLSGAIGQERDVFWIPSLKAQPSTFNQVDRTKGTLHPDNRIKSLTELSSPENASADEDSLPLIGSPSSPVPGYHGCHGDPPRTSSTSGDLLSKLTSTPCKLLTHLAANPATDITQILPTSDDESNPGKPEDGISCSRAYRLLMQYATTEAKQDDVARILEEGCVPNTDSKGGCNVKNKTISQALLDICL